MIAQRPVPTEPEGGKSVVPLRLRNDLSVCQQVYQDCSSWAVKDPLSLRYYRFREEEYAVLCLLDGKRGLEEIKHEYDRQFSPNSISLQELSHFIGTVQQSGLLVVDVPGQANALLRRSREQQDRKRAATLASVLAIRVGGVDPHRVLAWLLPATRWLFNPVAVVGTLVLGAAALLLVIVQFREFQSRLPDFYQFFSLGNSMWMLAAMAFAKVVHEFGHGIACKRYGGECHDMGLMFLVFTPCLYCNVSDSWMLPSKWQRAAVGAAGMYVELIIASVCTFLWWFSRPGLFNHVCLNLMFVCSVSTLLFNANPLLRYDGYYILADILEIPNLRAKASRVLHRLMARAGLGMQLAEDPLMPERHRWLFVAYAIAAVSYRWILVFSIMTFLLEVFRPYRLEPIGHAMIGVSLVGLVVLPLWRLGRFVGSPGIVKQMKVRNLSTTAGVVAAVVCIVAFVPLPHYVRCRFTIEPHGAIPVYIQTSGVLQTIQVRYGQSVEKDTPLAKLVNLELSQQVLAQEAELIQRRLQLSQLLRERFIEPNATNKVQELQEAIAALEEQLRTKREESIALNPLAPCSGKIIPPPEKAAPDKNSNQLPQWYGCPLDVSNAGCVLTAGALLCYVGDGKQWEAVLEIDSGDVEFVTTSQTVQLMLDQEPGKTWQGTVDIIARRELAPSSSVTTEELTSTKARPSPTYFAIVVLDDPGDRLRPALNGTAKIATASQTLLSRIVRWVRQTF